MLSALRDARSYAMSTARGVAENMGQLVRNKTETIANSLIVGGLFIVVMGLAVDAVGIVERAIYNSSEGQADFSNALISLGLGAIPLISGAVLTDVIERTRRHALQNQMHRVALPLPSVSSESIVIDSAAPAA
jgi:hypothetical protein